MMNRFIEILGEEKFPGNRKSQELFCQAFKGHPLPGKILTVTVKQASDSAEIYVREKLNETPSLTVDDLNDFLTWIYDSGWRMSDDENGIWYDGNSTWVRNKELALMYIRSKIK